MKKLFIAFLISVFLTLPVYANSYPDVSEDHENFYAIEYLDDHNVINGYENGTFGPENSVTRAEAMKIILNALNVEIKTGITEFFPDVTAINWFFDHVMTAYENNIINGYDNGEFKPDNDVNLAETLKMLLLTAETDLEENVDFNVFNDVNKNDWFAPHMLYAKDMNIILSDNEGNIYPNQSMTRAAFSEIVYRMMIILENDGQPFSIHENWNYYESSNLPFKMKYDDSWNLTEQGEEFVFWKADSEYNQFSPSRIYPNTAIVKVIHDLNEANLDQASYFKNIKDAFQGANYTEFNLGNLSALEVLYANDRIVDWYIYLNDGSSLVVYTEYGNGNLGYQNQQIIKSMLSTLEYVHVDKNADNYAVLLSEILENILIENTGVDTLDLLPESTIIETDTIGVGTGPVDYYYSETLDYTFKYERASDVILDYREGETTAF